MRHGEHTWSERPSTTLKDVARSVGVSESTASVVLNGSRSGTRVSQATRRNVLEAAEKLGYRPNGLARALMTGRTNRIGIYSGRSRLDARNLFFAEVLGGVFDGALEHGLNTVVHTSGNAQSMLLDLVSNRALDGLIVHAGLHDPLLSLLGELRVPAVAIADRIEGLPSVCIDDDSGGTCLARHLAQLGHRHVLYLQASHEPYSAVERMRAFCTVAEESGIEVTTHMVESRSTEVLNADAIRVLTRKNNRATAVAGWNDVASEYACRTLAALGLSIPGDVAVAGFDGFAAFHLPRFELTTIRVPWSEVGKVATSTLVALICGKSVPALTVLPVDFVRGATT